jgi:hypothetical protein
VRVYVGKCATGGQVSSHKGVLGAMKAQGSASQGTRTHEGHDYEVLTSGCVALQPQQHSSSRPVRLDMAAQTITRAKRPRARRGVARRQTNSKRVPKIKVAVERSQTI